MKKYPIIISDFDGTLACDDGSISEKNASAIKKYTQQGGIFAICTGRMMNSIKPHAERLGLNGLLVAYQGAQILDMKSGEFLRDERLSVQQALEICVEMEKHNLHIHVYNGDEFYTNAQDELLRYYENICKVKGTIIEGRLSDFIKENNIQPQKIIVLVMPEDKDLILNKLSDKLSANYYITASASILVEVAKYGCEKSTGVKFIANYYGFPLENVIAIGDNLNDLTMIETAGLGIAVGNAEDKLKKSAKEVCEFTNNENAVAHIIEKYGLGEK